MVLSFSSRSAAALFLLVGCTLCLVPVSQAELTWAKKQVDLKADASTSVLEAKFPFKNTGSQPVDINQVMSSCGCTTVNLEKRHYLPGEGGEIVAKYALGENTGHQKKTVLITTNDGTEPVELALTVQIPEVLRITPAFVTWKHGEAPEAKQVTLEMAQDTPIKEITVQSSSSTVTAELEPVVKGRKYLVTLKPSQTDQHMFATVSIRCKFGDTERVFRTYGTVQPLIREE